MKRITKNGSKKHTIALPIVLLSACVSPISEQRFREAKLMPVEVAEGVIEIYAPPGFSKSPALYPAAVRHPGCSDKSARPVKYEEMRVSGNANEVYITTDGGANFMCGSFLAGRILMPNEAARDDLIDALISMGAHPARKK